MGRSIRCGVGWHHRDVLVQTTYYDKSTEIGRHVYVVTEHWRCRCGAEYSEEYFVSHYSIHDNDPADNPDWTRVDVPEDTDGTAYGRLREEGL